MFHFSLSGMPALLTQIITIGIIWLAVIVVAKLVSRAFLEIVNITLEKDNDIEKREKFRKYSDRISKLVGIIATTIAFIAIVIFVLFQWNWQGRNPDEMNQVPQATIDSSYVSPTNIEIEKSNDQSHDIKASVKKDNNAKEENTKAMNDAINTFHSIAPKTDKSKEKEKIK